MDYENSQRASDLTKLFKPTQAQLTLILLVSIVVTSSVVYVATFSHGGPRHLQFVATGAFVCTAATITPIWLERLVFNGAAYQLFVVGWRLGTMLCALTIASQLPLAARNSIITTLLACYFVTLPLESWLLALRTRP